MSWNNKTPMELLSNLPFELSKANLEKMQAVVDNDRSICSTLLGRDLCGEYAPFCALCDKSIAMPCAVAYIRLKQAEGIKLEVAFTDESNGETGEQEQEVAEETPVAYAEKYAPAEDVTEDIGEPVVLQDVETAEEPVIEDTVTENTVSDIEDIGADNATVENIVAEESAEAILPEPEPQAQEDIKPESADPVNAEETEQPTDEEADAEPQKPKKIGVRIATAKRKK